MVIERSSTQIMITLPATVDLEGVQRLIDYLLYKEATRESNAKQDEVDEFARTVNKQWWNENKQRFLPE